MKGDPRAPFGGLFFVIVGVVAIVGLLSVLRVMGVDTEIRAVDNVVAVLLRTIGFYVG